MASQAVDRGSPACFSCGAAADRDAVSCRVCGALLGPLDGQDAQRGRCRIMRWRGYARSTFYVTMPNGSLLESRSFGWRRAAPPPDDEAARSAYESLVERLLVDGWERASQGATWYETDFVRRAQAMSSAQVLRTPLPAERAPEPEPEAGRWTKPHWFRAGMGAKRTPSLLASACLIVAATFVVTGAARTDATHLVAPPRAAAAIPKVVRHEASAPRTPVARPKLVDLRLGAEGSGSWLEVRRGSSSGRVLYSGVLLPGTRLRFHAPRLWARFGAAGNLSIVANGRPASLLGTYDKMFLPAAEK